MESWEISETKSKSSMKGGNCGAEIVNDTEGSSETSPDKLERNVNKMLREKQNNICDGTLRWSYRYDRREQSKKQRKKSKESAE